MDPCIIWRTLREDIHDIGDKELSENERMRARRDAIIRMEDLIQWLRCDGSPPHLEHE